MDDRAAGRQGVGRRSGRRGDDQTVGLVGRDVLTVDGQPQVDDARQGALGDHHVVEDRLARESAPLAHQRHLQRHAAIDAVASLKHLVQDRVDLVQPGFGEEPEAAQVDSQDRPRPRGEGARHRQQRAVAAHDDVQIRRTAGAAEQAAVLAAAEGRGGVRVEARRDTAARQPPGDPAHRGQGRRPVPLPHDHHTPDALRPFAVGHARSGDAVPCDCDRRRIRPQTTRSDS